MKISMILEYTHQQLHVKVVLLESFTSGLLETLSALTENKYSKWSSASQKHSNRGRIYQIFWDTKKNMQYFFSSLCVLYDVLNS